ncbi:MAG: RNA-directed DNA polymerase [Kiritimatiellia bacterium]|jgi:retron-type reverse transcriptase|nr:RNA-directed DNA polymerase [Kiritimatiellia bacterium]
MKRVGDLYATICSWDNLEQAARLARKRKRYRRYAEDFELKRESRLSDIREQLLSESWKPDQYTTFTISDPKERLICAPSYPDRIVHHAICNVIGPILERSFIDHSYSCRVGLGTGAARARCRSLVRSHSHVLKLDVRRYFPSIDHCRLKQKIARLIKCRPTLRLLDLIIDSWRDDEPNPVWHDGDDLLAPTRRAHGLPIGALTSQLFANLYLSRLDHYVQESIRPGGYVRYTDDLLVFGNDKSHLHAALDQLKSVLREEYLSPHPRKCRLHACREGVSFLGFRYWPDKVRVLRANRRRFEKRMLLLRRRVRVDGVTLREVWPSMFGWFQFIREYPANEGLVISESRHHSF